MQYLISFLEGIITFISPCLLPMLPMYISYFAGGDGSKRKTVVNAFGFVIGFTAVFVAMGALAGTLGSFLNEYRRAVDIVTGAVVVFFGLSFLGVFKLNIFSGIAMLRKRENPGFFSSALFGIIFSVGWTPCVGAFLGSALMLASQQGKAITGVMMLFFYSLGLGVPFIISAFLIAELKSTFNFIKSNYKIINSVCGALLIAMGILMMTGTMGRFLGIVGGN